MPLRHASRNQKTLSVQLLIMDSIKIRYTWKRPLDGSIWQEVVSIAVIEAGTRVSNTHNFHTLVARDLYIGKKDASGNEIFNNDILDWGDNFPSKVYYDSDECSFRIEELGIKKGEFAARTHDMESSTVPPNILGNIHLPKIEK